MKPFCCPRHTHNYTRPADAVVLWGCFMTIIVTGDVKHLVIFLNWTSLSRSLL